MIIIMTSTVITVWRIGEEEETSNYIKLRFTRCIVRRRVNQEPPRRICKSSEISIMLISQRIYYYFFLMPIALSTSAYYFYEDLKLEQSKPATKSKSWVYKLIEYVFNFYRNSRYKSQKTIIIIILQSNASSYFYIKTTTTNEKLNTA